MIIFEQTPAQQEKTLVRMFDALGCHPSALVVDKLMCFEVSSAEVISADPEELFFKRWY